MPLYFVAIVAPEEINRRVLQWKTYTLEKFGCKVAMRSPAHITLVPPFSMSANKEIEIIGAMTDCSKQISAFNLSLKDFDSFKPRVIFVTVIMNQHLEEVKNRTEDCLYEAGYTVKKETRPFHPHITIANRDLDRKDFATAWEHFNKMHFEASFRADNISLLRSEKDGWKVAGAAQLLFPEPPFFK